MKPWPQHDVARVPCDPDRATIYAEGWQSWSVTEILPITVTPTTDISRESLAIDHQYGVAPPRGVHQGSGLLAFDPGTGGPVELFAAPDASRWVPVIQARLGGAEIIVTADRPVDRRSDAGPGGLAGALGRPTWTLLPVSPDWRWLLDREDSVWYPTMRLFRQTRRKVWTDVVERVVIAMGGLLGAGEIRESSKIRAAKSAPLRVAAKRSIRQRLAATRSGAIVPVISMPATNPIGWRDR